MSKILDKAYRWREKADYKDYEEVTKAIAEEQLVNAEKFLASIEPFLQEKWTNG